MKIVKMDKLAGLVAALLLLCLIAPSCTARGSSQADVVNAEDTAAVKALISAFEAGNADADDLNKALIDAARDGNTAAIRLLINAGVDVNTNKESYNREGYTALILLLRKGTRTP